MAAPKIAGAYEVVCHKAVPAQEGKRCLVRPHDVVAQANADWYFVRNERGDPEIPAQLTTHATGTYRLRCWGDADVIVRNGHVELVWVRDGVVWRSVS